ncbi:anthranilate synthase component I family protein [Sporosarcina sp. PTS2304]|uniref:anthranilate synthase component I family protein n=1 Tax=Sporosarcina sp. PTS2304 TaxID=2283194 RepID=UPI000E0D0DC7|nr:anthranilate synthase component I family protein [Sporosarcina sp. PTS2304]AXI00746.1 anthranilate synthase component I family protein [Sporosarcina sp. PTS2304]
MKTIAYQTAPMTKDEFFYAYQHLARRENRHILLESGRGGEMCIAGFDPLITAQAKGPDTVVEWRDGKQEVRAGDPIAVLTDILSSYNLTHIENLPTFQGGALGMISYDYIRRYETLPILATNDLSTPDTYFYLFDQWAVLDVQSDNVYFMALPEKQSSLATLHDQWTTAVTEGLDARKFSAGQAIDVEVTEEDLAVSVTGEQFEQMVRDVQQYIAQGEVVQVNLSVRQSKPLQAPSLLMYEALRSFNPSPYMAYMMTPDFEVVSGSPELLLKKRGNELSTRPIGGTRKRGVTEVEDRALQDELISNTKEKGEHKMLVDLECADFEGICEPGTVEVDEFMVVEKYSHVMHLVSNVRGTAATQNHAEIIRGVFPGGSITGDPKLRTMEIIEELEPTRRGLYTGSIGWIGFDGNMELNITIRTAYIQNGIAHIQAGAGLVPESDPAAEYQESLNKAKALWQAKEMAEQVAKEGQFQ